MKKIVWISSTFDSCWIIHSHSRELTSALLWKVSKDSICECLHSIISLENITRSCTLNSSHRMLENMKNKSGKMIVARVNWVWERKKFITVKISKNYKMEKVLNWVKSTYDKIKTETLLAALRGKNKLFKITCSSITFTVFLRKMSKFN